MELDWMRILQQVVEVCLIPLLGLLTSYIIIYIKAKNKQFKQQVDNDLYAKYMDMLETTIVDCVIATNQTYTEALKKQNAFTAEAQKEAFAKTYNAVMAILSQDAVDYLTAFVGDLDLFIKQKIEAEVSENKKELKPAE